MLLRNMINLRNKNEEICEYFSQKCKVISNESFIGTPSISPRSLVYIYMAPHNTNMDKTSLT